VIFLLYQGKLSALSRVFHKKDITLANVIRQVAGCKQYVTRLCKVDGMLVHYFEALSFMFLLYNCLVSTLHQSYLSQLKKSELVILKIIWHTQLHCGQSAELNVKAVVVTIVF
jgi:hypothetical protein